MGNFFSSIGNYRVLHSLKQNEIEQTEIARITTSGIPEKLSNKIKRKSHQGKFGGGGEAKSFLSCGLYLRFKIQEEK